MLALAGCAARGERVAAPAPVVTDVPEPAWRDFARPRDLRRIDALGLAWREALDGVRARRDRDAIDAEGPLLDPAAAQLFPAPPPGRYRCRVVRLAMSGRVRGYQPWTCHVGNTRDLLSFTKEGGSDRPAGWLWADSDTRFVFLGAMAEDGGTPAYGDTDSYSLIGAVERVAEFRWRVVLPPQGGEWSLDVIELIPMVPPTPG